MCSKSVFFILPDCVLLTVSEDGNWSQWSPWTACSRSCDEGKKARSRKCDNPKPTNQGRACKGLSKEEVLCVQPRCHLGKLWSVLLGFFFRIAALLCGVVRYCVVFWSVILLFCVVWCRVVLCYMVSCCVMFCDVVWCVVV